MLPVGGYMTKDKNKYLFDQKTAEMIKDFIKNCSAEFGVLKTIAPEHDGIGSPDIKDLEE